MGKVKRAEVQAVEALYDIHSVLNHVDQVDYTYNGDGTVATEKFYKNSQLLFTLTFTYVASKVSSVVRT